MLSLSLRGVSRLVPRLLLLLLLDAARDLLRLDECREREGFWSRLAEGWACFCCCCSLSFLSE
jgi:hypothetical protein